MLIHSPRLSFADVGGQFWEAKRHKKAIKRSSRHQVILEKKHVSEAQAPSSKIGGKDTKFISLLATESQHGISVDSVDAQGFRLSKWRQSLDA